MTQAPKVNESQFQDILRQVRELLPFYTPEWKAAGEQDAGVALLKLFAHMAENVVNRLNRAPDKNFIAFLDMLGVQQTPAQAARAPLTFILSSGASENVLVPERTQAAAGEVMFETEKNMLAAPASLADAWSVVPAGDGAFQSPAQAVQGKPESTLPASLQYGVEDGATELFLDDASGVAEGDLLKLGDREYALVSEIAAPKVTLAGGLEQPHEAGTQVARVTEFELFQGKNRQEHVLYFAHKDLFQVKPEAGAVSKLNLRFAVAEPARPGLSLEWAYWGEHKPTEKDAWIVTQPASDGTAGFTKGGTVALPIGSEVNETEVNGAKNRWLRCRVKTPVLKKAGLPLLGAVSVATQNTVAPELAFANDVPLDLSLNDKTQHFKEYLHPFGRKPKAFDTFYLASSEAFSKKGAKVTLDFSSPSTGDVPVLDIYGIGPTFARRLEEAGIKTADELLKRSLKQLMEILKTTKEDLVANIIAAAGKKYVEASRRKKQVSLAAARAAAEPGEVEVDLSWEYWNGKGWTVIKDLHDGTACFQMDEEVVFPCPQDIASTKVGGQESYWIRVKIAGGDYGKEIVYDEASKQWVPGDIYPPLFNKLTVAYEMEGQALEKCLTYNNLVFSDVTDQCKTSNKPFSPFQALDDEHQAMYLGFDKRLRGGPLSIFFSLAEAMYAEESLPRVEWEYFAETEKTKGWARLEVLDGTRNLTQTGALEFVAPQDFAASTFFGKELYWLRAVDAEDRFESLSGIYFRIADRLPLKYRTARYLPGYVLRGEAKLAKKGAAAGDKAVVGPATAPCAPSYSEAFRPPWGQPPEMRDYAPSPKISGIYLNTTWAVQSETVRDEVMGSSDGSAGQSFTLTKTPITSADLWVNEMNALSEAEMTSMLADSSVSAKAARNDQGSITAFWVKWKAVDSLLESSKSDRHYQLDHIAGTVRFGDGVNGAIPPIGTDNIKADYRSGGGTKGNVENAQITGLKTSVPFVDKVSNPVASEGGSEKETLDSALARGPQAFRNRGRAVGAEDFEWLARQASPGIARAKCLPNFDDRGERKPGWVTVIIVPASQEDSPRPSLELQTRVERYLQERTANTVAGPEHLQVSGPVYVAVGVEAELVCRQIDMVPLAQKEAFSRLKSFLHPLTGGDQASGWDFGKMPCLSDFYALLEQIQGVDHVKSLAVKVTAGEGKTASGLAVTPEEPSDIGIPEYTLIYSGEHKITATFEKET